MPQTVAFSRLLPMLCRRRADAFADVRGSAEYPALRGTVRFYQTAQGVIVLAEVCGLPESGERCGNRIFAFHIHSGGACAGTAEEPFADALGHYNPEDCPHPEHAGDMPPLFSNGGSAAQAFLTDRFRVRDIIGRTVIIHAGPDDFHTQPSGNAGPMIACGVIRCAGSGR